MEIKTLVVGVYQTNCYLIIKDNNVLVIDPGSKANAIIDAISDLKVIAIFLTHGHLDHIGACDMLYQKYKCPIYVGEEDKEMLRNPDLNCSGKQNIVCNAPVKSAEEKIYQFDKLSVDVYKTPGHTLGSVIYKIEDCLFTGDTLFHYSVGRTDLPTGSESDLRKSLRIFKNFDPNLKVYPGHEDNCVLSDELINNPYL